MKFKKFISHDGMSFIELTRIKDNEKIKEFEQLQKNNEALPDDIIGGYEPYVGMRYYEIEFPEDVDSNLTNYLLAECIHEQQKQNEKISTIKNCTIFFTVITVINLIIALLAEIFKIIE